MAVRAGLGVSTLGTYLLHLGAIVPADRAPWGITLSADSPTNEQCTPAPHRMPPSAQHTARHGLADTSWEKTRQHRSPTSTSPGCLELYFSVSDCAGMAPSEEGRANWERRCKDRPTPNTNLIGVVHGTETHGCGWVGEVGWWWCGVGVRGCM